MLAKQFLGDGGHPPTNVISESGNPDTVATATGVSLVQGFEQRIGEYAMAAIALECRLA